ncbi:MAG: nickel-dependent lactate racemase [candidate division WOR-3 bacterium]|nr:MAG: nickel-dependent lactate racemase [candidate division WOR-3 bacterium]
MRRLAVPYGNTKEKIEVDEKYILDIIDPYRYHSGNAEKTLIDALRNPVEGKVLPDFIGSAQKLCIIVNDAARPTRTDLVLSAVREFISGHDIHFIVATGAHRPPNKEELMAIFGQFYNEYKERIVTHDARDESMLDHIGQTRYGNDILLNRLVVRGDKVLIIGSIEPHYFAGYTGDRKALLPGITGYRTIENNHRLALHAYARPLQLNGNPIHEEMLDCATALGRERIYSIQMILDRKRNIHRAYAGAIIKTLETAADEARCIFSAPISRKADIVVTVAQLPFDINLYQTLKSIEHGRLALNDGGILIFVSRCPEGLGPPSFARLFESEDSIEAAAIKAKTEYRLGDHNAYNLMTLCEHGRIWGVTDIADTTLRNAQIVGFGSLQAALDQAIKEKGTEHSILLLTNGSMTVPVCGRY